MADENKSETQLKSEAYQAAATRLKAKYPDDYRAMVAAEMTARGVEWKPRATAEDRAKEKLHAIYREFPHLIPTVGTD